MAGQERYVAYYRVSTQRQGRSGLGLDAQRTAVAQHLNAAEGILLAEHTEVESGLRCTRPELDRALAHCRALRATLIIAKLDRLSRNAAFLLKLIEGTGSLPIVICDLPNLPGGPVGKFMLTQFAAVAELEAGLISQRTRQALAAAKARGVRLGNPALRAGDGKLAELASVAWSRIADEKARSILPYVHQARASGARTLREVAEALELRGIRAPNGGTKWSPSQVSRVENRTKTAITTHSS